MILSRILLNPACAEAWTWAGSFLALHGALWRLFPEVPRDPDARARAGILHRLEVDRERQRLELLVQSRTTPTWSNWPSLVFASSPETKSLEASYAALHDGEKLRFRLVGNAVRAKARTSHHLPIHDDEGRRGWIERASARSGFAVESVMATARSHPVAHAGKPSPTHVVHPVQYDGQLVVRDVPAFRAALANGVGRGKSYGCGLLLVARTAG